MDQRTLKKLMEDNEFLNERIKYYFNKNIIYNTNAKYEIEGHLEKARHNLDFLEEIRERYNDWALVVCYYSLYHSALSLILTKNYFSKNHDATMLILIKEFYDKNLTREDIDLLNRLNTEEILFYAQSKNRREEASYSTKIKFERQEVNNIKIKTKLFVNKAEKIIREE